MGARGSRSLRSCFLATAVALAPVALAGCSRGGEEREASGTCTGRIGSSAAAEAISTTGGRILRDIAEARADTHRGYLLRAEGRIDRADRRLDVIEQSVPTAEVRRRIWVARRHLGYAEIKEVMDDLQSIHTVLGQVESLAPTDSILGHLDRTKWHLEKGNREAAGRELERADQELLFVEIDLPLSSTRRHLAEAREALDMNAAEAAAAYLKQADDDLAFLTALARSPLEAVLWSLAKAVTAYTRGDIERAEQYVTLARWSVGQSGVNGSLASHQASQEVMEELRGLEGRLAAHGADVTAELEGLTHRVRALVHSGCG